MGKQLSFIDIFCGCGGISLGFTQAGFKPVAGIDSDSKACETHKLNFQKFECLTLEKDLGKFGPEDFIQILSKMGREQNIHVITGGPPCQGWSRVGRGKIRSLFQDADAMLDDPRNHLYKSFIHYVKFIRPLYFVMENVPGMLSHNGKDVTKLVISNFRRIGYRVQLYLVDAVDYGVPQRRFRLIFIGARKDTDLPVEGLISPLACVKRYYRGGYTKQGWHINLKQAICDLPSVEHGCGKEVQEYYRPAGRPSKYSLLMRKGCNGLVFDHVTRWHNCQDISAFSCMKPGMQYAKLDPKFKRYRDDIFKDKYKKLRWDEPAGTVTAHLAHDCYTHIHPEQPRTVSVREAARLQSFADNFRFVGGIGDRFRQIGNAVPPLLAWNIGISLKKALLKHYNGKIPHF